ncbi:hypothetical protein J3R82DRAFT_12028 [Butyriboletus roseoflavus]|nr:hypothetical protein J3R82DRAFT_12028 [Butyriboletus roseoflavus]
MSTRSPWIDQFLRTILLNIISVVSLSLCWARLCRLERCCQEYQLHLIIDVSSASRDLAKAVAVHGGYPLHLEVSYWLRGANHENISLARVANAGMISRKDDEQVESLCATGVGEIIGVSRLVRDAFNDAPFNAMPYVVVERLAERPRGILRPHGCRRMHQETIPTALGPRKVLPCSLPSMHEETIPTASEKQEEKTPSGAAKPSSFRTRRADKEKRIPCGRPRSHEETIPLTLLHPVFGEFVDNCKTNKITPDDYTFAIDLTNTMSSLYDNEVARFQVVRGVFQQYGIHFTDSVVNGKFVVDADMSTNGHRYVIAKFKDEVGSISAEPYFESILHYLESTKNAAVEFPWSPLPCFLLAIVG